MLVALNSSGFHFNYIGFYKGFGSNLFYWFLGSVALFTCLVSICSIPWGIQFDWIQSRLPLLSWVCFLLSKIVDLRGFQDFKCDFPGTYFFVGFNFMTLFSFLLLLDYFLGLLFIMLTVLLVLSGMFSLLCWSFMARIIIVNIVRSTIYVRALGFVNWAFARCFWILNLVTDGNLGSYGDWFYAWIEGFVLILMLKSEKFSEC